MSDTHKNGVTVRHKGTMMPISGGMTMVEGEPDDVRVEYDGGHWAVLLVEEDVATRILFRTKAVAESFAEVQRWRLGLPGGTLVAYQS